MDMITRILVLLTATVMAAPVSAAVTIDELVEQAGITEGQVATRDLPRWHGAKKIMIARVSPEDIAVLAEFRGLGLSRLMLTEVEKIAREKGCCKITLEVLEGNTAARRAYERFGFHAYELAPALGKAMFWQKAL